MGLDLHPARPSTLAEREDWGNWYYDLAAPSPQWSYGGFKLFRERLAESEGFDLSQMAGFGGTRDWDEITTDLKPLLCHSDCDGEMTAAECAQVAPRLYGVLASWDQRGIDLMHDLRSGAELVKAMEMCAAGNLTLVFR